MTSQPLEQHLCDLLREIERSAAGASSKSTESASRPIESATARTTAPADHAGATQPAARVCPLCETPLLGFHCKLICSNCGYREDCSDLF